jgi:serine/threonine-protein kinase
LAAGVNRERFRREVQLAAQLQHPHIVPLYAAGEHGELLYYTMPFIEGESLRHALEAKASFSPREVIRILRGVADALGYAHERGVIHRDIKPGNILRSGPHAVVTDFGVAKAISASLPVAGMTTTGMAIGTPAYMAPEQLAGDPKADHRVDIYALGLTAYELLTGAMPFAASSPAETMAAQLTLEPAPLDKVRRDVPPALSTLVMRCMAKKPDDRPQSARELLGLIDAADLSSTEVAVRPGNRQAWITLAAAGVALAAVAVWQRGRLVPAPVVVRDTVTVSPGGPLMTRAESLAIARAVEARLAEHKPAEPKAGTTPSGASSNPTKSVASAVNDTALLRRMADSIREEIQRAVFDTLARIQAGRGTQSAARGGDPFGRRGGAPDFSSGGRGFVPEPNPPASQGSRSTQVVVRGPTPPGARGTSAVGFTPEIDSILREAERITADMGRRTNALDAAAWDKRAASLGPVRRIVVVEPRLSSSQQAAAGTAAAIADSARRAFTATKRFVAVPRDTVNAAVAKTRTVDDLAAMLNADVFASFTAYRAGPDSLQWQLTLRDLTAHSAYRSRLVNFFPAPMTEMTPRVDEALGVAVRFLNEMDRAPRRSDVPPTRGRP